MKAIAAALLSLHLWAFAWAGDDGAKTRYYAFPQAIETTATIGPVGRGVHMFLVHGMTAFQVYLWWEATHEPLTTIGYGLVEGVRRSSYLTIYGYADLKRRNSRNARRLMRELGSIQGIRRAMLVRASSMRFWGLLPVEEKVTGYLVVETTAELSGETPYGEPMEIRGLDAARLRLELWVNGERQGDSTEMTLASIMGGEPIAADAAESWRVHLGLVDAAAHWFSRMTMRQRRDVELRASYLAEADAEPVALGTIIRGTKVYQLAGLNFRAGVMNAIDPYLGREGRNPALPLPLKTIHFGKKCAPLLSLADATR